MSMFNFSDMPFDFGTSSYLALVSGGRRNRCVSWFFAIRNLASDLVTHHLAHVLNRAMLVAVFGLALTVLVPNMAQAQRGVSSDKTENLRISAAWNELMVVKAMIVAGADVNAKDESGRNSLHWAVGGYKKPTPKLIKVLIAAGADVNARTEEGETPLHIVAGWGDSNEQAHKIIEMLIAAGADVSKADRYGNTPNIASTLKSRATALPQQSSSSRGSSDWEGAAPSISGDTSGSAGSGGQRGQSSSSSGIPVSPPRTDRERINASMQGANHCLDWKPSNIFFNGLFWVWTSQLRNKCSLPIVVGLAYLTHEDHGENYRPKCQRDVFVLNAHQMVQSGLMSAGNFPEGAFVSATMGRARFYGFRNKNVKPSEKYRIVRKVAGTYNEDIHPKAKSEAIKAMKKKVKKLQCPD